MHTTAVVGAQTRLDGTEDEPVDMLDNDLDKGFTFSLANKKQGPLAIVGVAPSMRGRRKEYPSRDRYKQKNLGFPERQPSESLQQSLMGLGLPGLQKSPYSEQSTTK